MYFCRYFTYFDIENFMKGLLIAMRKEYVKPVMESEEFVTNEYIAACWTFSCQHCSYSNKIGGNYTENELDTCVNNYPEATIHSGRHAASQTVGTGAEDSSSYYHTDTSTDRCHPLSYPELAGRGTTANAS